MIEQWFLDLDGVRSGPYQTPEVMSLIAEGEVLPHHRIATGLSSTNWITILDWRLDQAKLSQKPKPAPAYRDREISTVEIEDEHEDTNPNLKILPRDDLSHFTEHKVELEVPVEAKKEEPAAPLKFRQEPVATPQATKPDATGVGSLATQASTPPVQVSSEPKAASTTAFDQAKLAPVQPAPPKEPPKSAKGAGDTAKIKKPGNVKKSENIDDTELLSVPTTELKAVVSGANTAATSGNKSPGTPGAASTTTLANDAEATETEAADAKALVTPRRDPMAEMFDVLQKTKQKREAKLNHSASSGISIEKDDGTSAKSFNLGRTLLIGGGITLVGFALGQLFQHEASPQHEPNATVSSTPKPVQTPAIKPTPEVIDRSTDKLTIRGTVEHKPEPAKPAPTKAAPAKATTAERTENPQTEKELEELRNLKRELQELKNLKTNAVEEPPQNTDTDESFDAVDPNGGQAPAAESNSPQGSNNSDGQQPLGR